MTRQSVIALEKENVLISAGNCALTLLPHLGGKIASIHFAGHELLQTPIAPLAPRTRTMPFDASDASGWDECFPSVAACTVSTSAGPAPIPDHGDLWRVEWSIQRSEPALTLIGECFSLPLALQRTIALTETPKGAQLRLDYTVTNTGSHPAPWSWAAHSLFAVEPGDEIELPASVHALRLEGSGGKRLGNSGATVSWPIAALANGSQSDLRVAQPPASAIGDKLFAGPLAVDENWCVLHRRAAGLHIRVRFDTTATPYLGLWICYGGWPDRPGPKQNCVAVEPSTAPVDSLAQMGPWSRMLDPGQSDSWPMFVDFEMN